MDGEGERRRIKRKGRRKRFSPKILSAKRRRLGIVITTVIRLSYRTQGPMYRLEVFITYLFIDYTYKAYNRR